MVSQASRAGGLDPFLDGMAGLGYQPGKNFELDERWGENSREKLERLALEALARKPALFVSQGPALQLARKLPGGLPVVFGTSGDPVEMGVAATLARPGGNFTGVTFLSYALVGKRVELLHEVPRMHSVWRCFPTPSTAATPRSSRRRARQRWAWDCRSRITRSRMRSRWTGHWPLPRALKRSWSIPMP